MGYDVGRFVGDVDAELICPICHGVLEDPHQAPQCEHAFCEVCINEWLRCHHACPLDRTTCDPSQLKPIPRILKNLLSRLTLRCDFFEYGCQQVIRLELLLSHKQDCEFNPHKPITCELGCQLAVSKDQLKTHNCVRELRTVVQQQQSQLANVQMEINEVRVQYNDMRRDLRAIRDSVRALHLSSGLPVLNSPPLTFEMDDIARWVASLPPARVTRWGGMISTPDTTLQAVMRRSLVDSGCPTHCVDELVESAHERRWPSGLSTLEMRQLNRRQFENYVCRRIPGRQAVLVMSCENLHMADGLVLDPGIVMIFAHGVE
jgi:E3 ubiquitin-protein ligase NRDP1